MRVAIIGSGQLARMMAMAGLQIGVRCSFLAEPQESAAPVEGLGALVRRDPAWGATEILAALGNPDVVTVERESVDVELLRALADHCPVYPDPNAVAKLQHRLQEKDLVASLGLDTAPYRGACANEQVAAAAQEIGLPVVVKSCRDGYDGRGQYRIESQQDLLEFSRQESHCEWLVEQKIAFDREISLLAVRSCNGEVAFYPATENRHQDGVLVSSLAPANALPESMQALGENYLRALLQELDYVGVLAMECFVAGDRLLINELAPRVHNSGHWTLRSEATCQFENHLRAVLGLPLGDTRISRCEGIINILGYYDRERIIRQLPAGTALVDYNKSAAPRRKIAHVHVSGDDHCELERALVLLSASLQGADQVKAGALQ